MTFLADKESDKESLTVDGIPEDDLRASTVHNVNGGREYPSVEHIVKHERFKAFSGILCLNKVPLGKVKVVLFNFRQLQLGV